MELTNQESIECYEVIGNLLSIINNPAIKDKIDMLHLNKDIIKHANLLKDKLDIEMKEKYVRCRIEGRYKGQDFIYEDPSNKQGTLMFNAYTNYEDIHYYWSEGNMCSDANRLRFIPLDLLRNDYGQFYIPTEKELVENESIEIKIIIPLEGDYRTIDLNEY